MDQLHTPHDNDRPANAPAKTRNIAEHQTAQNNGVQHTAPLPTEQGSIPDGHGNNASYPQGKKYQAHPKRQ